MEYTILENLILVKKLFFNMCIVYINVVWKFVMENKLFVLVFFLDEFY